MCIRDRLGAGASVGAGVPYMSKLVAEILEKHDQGGEGDEYERFDRYWRGLDRKTRASVIAKHLKAEPSDGYKALARLMKDGWFDAVVTFNYDDLLEQALNELGVDYEDYVREKDKDSVFAEFMLDDDLGPRVLKIHGSFKGANIFLGSCLLYTSPSPRDLSTSRMPSSA